MHTVILDRDGVINFDSPDYIKSPDEWIPIPGSIEAIARLSSAGLKVVVATNQSGIARGYYDEYALARMHEKFQRLVAEHNGQVDVIAYCPHGPDSGCACRKPKTGMLVHLQQELGVSLKDQPFIGDSMRDLLCARDFGCIPILVRTGNGIETESNLRDYGLTDVTVADSLSDVVYSLLN